MNWNDPSGLCSVIIGGITQTPNTDNTNYQQEFANKAGAISAFPYAGGNPIGDIANIMVQGLGVPTGATYTALQAIALAAKNPGSIDIFAYSGGAAAFTSAWNYLRPEVKNRIASITYIDPGSAESLQAGNGATVNVYSDASDFTNISLILVGGSVPLSAKFHDTGKLRP